MPVRHIDHILIAMPAGREDEARAFYLGILGLDEKVKPPQLARVAAADLKADICRSIWAWRKTSFRRGRRIRPLSLMTSWP